MTAPGSENSTLTSDDGLVALAVRASWLSIAVLVACTACSKKEADKPARRDPWLAQQPDAQAGIGMRTKFAIDPRCDVAVDLPARESTPRGTFRVCKGELDVNLSDLAQSRGTLSIDLGSIEMRGEGDGGRSDDYTQRAQNWLDIGASRPEAERERLRWATFTLSSVSDASFEAAHLGKVVRDDTPKPTETADIDGDGGKSHAETRAVSLSVKGDLLLHGIRVELASPIRVLFHYPDGAAADRSPDRIRLETTRPIPIPLKLHDIQPRSSSGTHLSEEMKLVGSKVGADAKISFSIGASTKIAP